MVEGVLHHEHPTNPAKWCIVAPREEQPKLLQEHHGGRFARHFAERKCIAPSTNNTGGKTCDLMFVIIVVLA